VGIYLFGSAVTGGLKRNSDVDILVVVNDSPTHKQKEALVTQLIKVSGAIGNVRSIRPIEMTVISISDVVPWQFPPRAEFIYGEWLRNEFEAGHIPKPAYDADLAIRDSLPTLLSETAGDERNVVLTLSRMFKKILALAKRAGGGWSDQPRYKVATTTAILCRVQPSSNWHCYYPSINSCFKPAHASRA